MCGQIGHTLSIWDLGMVGKTGWFQRPENVLKDAAGRTFFGYDLDHTWRQDEDLGDNKRTFERTKVSQLWGGGYVWGWK